MKKTTTIHLSGVLFNIEEDAYEQLKDYLTSIESYFDTNQSKKEIVEDIENRIAELLSEKTINSKKVVQTEDITWIIQKMGNPEEFGEGEKTQDFSKTQASPQDREGETKKIYRDPDNKILGGVCAGIANYFGFDPLWLRLFWAILFFAYGTGIFIYILLWVIIPKAETPSQKLEMKGEPINISNIGKQMEHDTKDISGRFVNFIQSILGGALIVLAKLGKIILKIISVFILMICLLVLFVLLAGMFGKNVININSSYYTFHDHISHFFSSNFHYWLFMVSLLLIIGVPIISGIIGAVKLLFGIKKKLKWIVISSIIIGIIGGFLFFYTIIPVAQNFSKKSQVKNTYSQYLLPQKTLYVQMNTIKNSEEQDDDNFSIEFNPFSNVEEELNYGHPSINIYKSKDDSIRITIVSEAFGKDKKSAKTCAQHINYQFAIQDSILDLSSQYIISQSDKFKFQHITVNIEMPKDRYIYLSKNLKKYLDDAENNIKAYEEDMVGKKWLMGYEELVCLQNCDDIANLRKHHVKPQYKIQHKEEQDE